MKTNREMPGVRYKALIECIRRIAAAFTVSWGVWTSRKLLGCQYHATRVMCHRTLNQSSPPRALHRTAV